MIRHLAFALICMWVGAAHAFDPFVVRDIRVEGIQRIEAGTVFSYLPVKVGETMTDEKAVAAIKALFATGFFKDVRLEVQRDVLIVMIEERPAVSQIDFIGNKEFDKDALRKGLREAGLSEGRSLDKALLDQAEQEIKRQYLARGRYGASVVTTVMPLERNRVGVSFSINEGEVTKIRQINIIGNKVFKEKDLLQLLVLQTPGWLTWYTKNDQYSKQKLSGDLETLRSHYLNNGYLEFNIDSTQVSITPDKKDIYITINVTEGEKYTVNDIKFEGELFGREDELRSLVLLHRGDVYSGARLTATNKLISDRLGTFGYAFANVNANPDIDRAKREVSFTFFVDPGKRAYVRHMNISGNTSTRDEVIRREFRQFESSWYDANKIKLSRDRVDRLGYFKDVTIDTPEAQGTNDQVDVNLAVTEKPTGNFQIGGAFSQSEKFSLSASVQQANFAGSGNTVGIDLNTSKYSRTIALSGTNPYYTDDGVSRSEEIYLRTTQPPAVNIGSYTIKQEGGRVSWGVPFSETDTVFFGLGLERSRIDTDSTSPLRFRNYVADINGTTLQPTDIGYGVGSATTNAVPLTAAWARDSRDSSLTPTVGRYQRANLELDLIGNSKYYRAVYEQQWYKPLFKKITLALKGEFDYGHGIGDKPYPVFKNFYGGGIGSVRGYESSSLGAVDPTTYDALGGPERLIGNAELQMPFPGSGNDRSLRWFGFLDSGQVYQEGEKMRASELRYSTGLGISWISPVGPLKLSYAKPLNAKPGDRLERFQFQMGTGF